jgi:DNA repair exonuclease SbcCD ATPase subunit
VEQLLGEIRDLQVKVAASEKAERELDKKYRTADEDFHSYKKAFRDIQQELNQTLETIQARNQQLQQTEEDYENLQQNFSKASVELIQLKLESRPNSDDAFFRSRFLALQSDIGQWSRKYFWGEKRKKNILRRAEDVPHICNKLEDLSVDCRDYLLYSEDGSTRPFIAEAYLWKFIEDRIFDSSPPRGSCSEGMFWAQKIRPEVARVERVLRPGGLMFLTPPSSTKT